MFTFAGPILVPLEAEFDLEALPERLLLGAPRLPHLIWSLPVGEFLLEDRSPVALSYTPPRSYCLSNTATLFIACPLSFVPFVVTVIVFPS